jgi:anti-anti-sigma regulatory factor
VWRWKNGHQHPEKRRIHGAWVRGEVAEFRDEFRRHHRGRPSGPAARNLRGTRPSIHAFRVLVAAVFEDTFPLEWTGRQAALTLPEHIDVSNAGQISEQLLLVINRGATALIVDMTATASCDHAAAEAVVRAYRRALASGTQVRLVVTTPIARQVLSINGSTG